MPFNGIIFSAVFQGQPNINAGRSGGVFGMKRFLKRLSSENVDENPLLPLYQSMVDEIGMAYMQEVMQQFAAKHGRSGETARSIESTFIMRPTGMVYGIKIAGNVGFVINPLPERDIPGRYFNNPQTQHMGRQTNFYSPFEYIVPGKDEFVHWYQGGNESFSPDRSWYKDELPDLKIRATAEFSKLGAQVAVLWGQGGNA